MIDITETEVPEDEASELATRRSRERDETQVALDGRVEKALTEWRALPNHKNVGHGKRPTVRLVVATEDVRELKRMIRRSFTLHKAEPVWYKDKALENGRTAVKFTVNDLPAKPIGNGNTPAETKPAEAKSAAKPAGARR